MRAYLSAGLLGGSAALFAAWPIDDTPAGHSEAATRLPAAPAPDLETPTTVNEIQLAVGRDVPGFGGFWVDPEQPDRLKIWLTDASEQLEPTKASLARLIGDYPALDLSKVDVLTGRYGFLQLEEWHELILPVAAEYSGWTSLDVQEKANRIWIGVMDDGTQEQIERRLTQVGIPLDAVEFRLEPKPDLRSCPPNQDPDELTDCYRPVTGGFEIQGETAYGAPLGRCTVGFLAKRNGIQGMVTASHCTEHIFNLDNWPTSSEFHQDEIENRVGVEAVDPPPQPYIGNCPGSYVCRFADAAWIQLDSGVAANQGWIARPEYGSPEWNYNLFRVSGVIGSYVGKEVFMVGKKTGLSQGFVDQTNVDMPYPTQYYPNALLLDQHIAGFYGDYGDSGGPVFSFTENPTDLLNIYLVGIHWGGPVTPGSVSYYSDVQYAQFQNWDLGPLDVLPPPSGGGGR